MGVHKMMVYGTLKRGEPNNGLMQDPSLGVAKFYGACQTVHRYPLIIASIVSAPFLLDAPGQGKRIYGEIYEVDDDMLAALDHLEVYPQLYDRITIPVQLLTNKSHHDMSHSYCIEHVFTYILRDFKRHLLEYEYIDSYHNLPEVCFNCPEGDLKHSILKTVMDQVKIKPKDDNLFFSKI